MSNIFVLGRKIGPIDFICRLNSKSCEIILKVECDPVYHSARNSTTDHTNHTKHKTPGFAWQAKLAL
jgi:hypothetical protein